MAQKNLGQIFNITGELYFFFIFGWYWQEKCILDNQTSAAKCALCERPLNVVGFSSFGLSLSFLMEFVNGLSLFLSSLSLSFFSIFSNSKNKKSGPTFKVLLTL